LRLGYVFDSVVMKFLWWIPAFTFGLLIFWFSDQSSPPGSDLGPDYLVHFLEFGLFAVAVAFGFTRGFQTKLTLGRAFLAFSIASFYGCMDEFHQSFVPGRTPAVSDFLADSLGALVFLGLTAQLMRLRNRQPES